MRQGKISSHGVSEYSGGIYRGDQSIRLYYAKFREAFAVAAFVVDNVADLPFPEGALATFAPGDLKVFPHDRIWAE